MIVIYPYKRKSNDFMLLESVRVFRKFYPNAVFYTVGDYVEGLGHIYFKDSSHIRGCNVTAKVLHVATLFDEFIYMNDDFFINDRYDFNKRYGGEQLERKDGKASIEWNVSVDNTKHWLEHNGFSTRSYECHQPIKFNSKLLLHTFKQIQWKHSEHFLKSIYCNVNETDVVVMENVKLKEDKVNKAELYLNIYGCFSASPGFLTEKGVAFIKSL